MEKKRRNQPILRGIEANSRCVHDVFVEISVNKTLPLLLVIKKTTICDGDDRLMYLIVIVRNIIFTIYQDFIYAIRSLLFRINAH